MATSQAAEDFDGLALLTREFLGVPVCLVTLVDSDRQCFLGQAGLEEPWSTTRVTPLSLSICQHVVATDEPLVIPDTRADDRIGFSGALTELGVAAYLGVPLRSSRGHVLGSFCAIDEEPRQWTGREIRLLEGLGRFAERIIDGHVKEMELRRNREGMIRLERMESLGRLAAGVVHDLNNVLATAGLHAELAAAAPEADLPQHLEAVLNSVRAGARLTDGLLRFSHTTPADSRTIRAGAALREISQMLSSLATERIHVVSDFHDVDGFVHMSRGNLEQLMMNLFSNALDAMPEGGTVRMSGRTRWQPAHVSRWGLEIDEGDYLEISISDSGDGIPDAVAETLFEPFVTSKPLGRGTGLGLAAVYGFVRGAGGSIDFDTEPGTGTTFTVMLPLDAGDHEERAQSDTRPLTPAPQTSPVPILIVDDESAIRGVLTRVVQRYDLPVLAAEGTEEAMAKLPGGPVLLITDVHLRDGNGVDLARRVTEANPDSRVVFMSGAIEPDHLADIPESQRAGVLQKPFSLADVEALLTDVR